MPTEFAVKIVRLKDKIIFANPVTLTFTQGHSYVLNLTYAWHIIMLKLIPMTLTLIQNQHLIFSTAGQAIIRLGEILLHVTLTLKTLTCVDHPTCFKFLQSLSLSLSLCRASSPFISLSLSCLKIKLYFLIIGLNPLYCHCITRVM